MDANAKSDGRAKPDDRDCAPLGGPGCECRAAVVRAFEGMVHFGTAYDGALSVALRVFRHHHPEIEDNAREMVERWISADSLH